MPYIPELRRREWDAALTAAAQVHAATFVGPGQMNYLITALLNQYLCSSLVGYDALNEVIGILECAKQEFYRRVIAGYEDVKRTENGDVYESTQAMLAVRKTEKAKP